MIAVLFAMKDGCYSEISGIDLWHKERDARKYQGPYPVIAHPPCQLWGKFAKINYKRWGGEHNRPGNDGGCFEFALASVNNYGGVLEHPAYSYAWQQYGLVKPTSKGWTASGNGYVCEVNQASYGHRATKKTWLYYFGEKPFELRWDKTTGTHQIGFHDQRGKNKNKPTLSRREANATPIDFRDELLKLAAIVRIQRNSLVAEEMA